MARFTGSKNKLSRGLGFDIFNKGEKLKKAAVLPGGRRPKKISEYGKQLKSKQTIKNNYGVLEKQFRNYVLKALKLKGNPSDNLIILLERRLDNVLYRSGYTKTRPAARQMVSHGHISVNDKTLSIPSYETKVGDIIGVDDVFASKEELQSLLAESKNVPGWIGREDFKMEIRELPNPKEVEVPVAISDIIEFYSR